MLYTSIQTPSNIISIKKIQEYVATIPTTITNTYHEYIYMNIHTCIHGTTVALVRQRLMGERARAGKKGVKKKKKRYIHVYTRYTLALG